MKQENVRSHVFSGDIYFLYLSFFCFFIIFDTTILRLGRRISFLLNVDVLRFSVATTCFKHDQLIDQSFRGGQGKPFDGFLFLSLIQCYTPVQRVYVSRKWINGNDGNCSYGDDGDDGDDDDEDDLEPLTILSGPATPMAPLDTHRHTHTIREGR